MQVSEVMTPSPVCCTPSTSLREVARMMVENDCGCIPVLQEKGGTKLIGVITDRDICCRTVAEGRNPLQLTVGDCMSKQCVTAKPETSLDECCELMERHQIRRVPITDSTGMCCGIVAQADIARRTPAKVTAEVVKEVSKRTAAA